METKEIVDKLREWDFNNKTKKEFALVYNISIRTIDNYINKYNINYNKRSFGILIPRDRYGKFCLKNHLQLETVPPKTDNKDKNKNKNKNKDVIDPNLSYSEKIKKLESFIKI